MASPFTHEQPAGAFAATLRYFSGGRAREAALMVGFPLAGPVFALHAATLAAGWRVLAFAGAMFLFFLSLYDFNDYGGQRADALNPRLRDLPKYPRGLLLKRTAVTLAAAVLGLGLLKPLLAVGAVVSFGLWSLYSWPAGWKEVPVLGTAVHLVTQALHFLMGWALVAGVTLDAVLVSVFFGGLFAGGHLFHEVIDFEADREAGLRTTANRIGRGKALGLSTALFLLCAAYWTLLYLTGRIDAASYVPFLAAFAVHAAALTLSAIAGRLQTRPGALLVRRAYRTAYLLAGLSLVVLKFGASAALKAAQAP
jgi:4-hydroxybenzoate polyprenyltransferase